MSMTNPHQLAQALAAIAAAHPDVAEAHTGALAAIPSTPAVEVLLQEGQLAQLPAGGAGHTEQRHEFILLVLEAMAPTVSEETEAVVAGITTDLINTINAHGFDDTLGGLTERTRATAYRFDVTSRNGRAYRVAAIRIETGEI